MFLVDVQKAGLYKLWRHTHRFEAHGDLIRMIVLFRGRFPASQMESVSVLKLVQGQRSL
jgi:ligand-binding SRPBCC domain-containing protein